MKTNKDIKQIEREVLLNPAAAARKRCLDSFYFFFMYFWSEISGDTLQSNWHIEYLCNELQKVAERVGQKKPKKHDLIINVPPGSSKTSIVSIMFPVWCWTRYHWMRFITAGYSATLSLEAAEYSRDLIRSERFKSLFPELEIKDDKDTKSNFRLIRKEQTHPGRRAKEHKGGNRYSTSVGGTLTGFHGHILIVDDPLNPQQALSKVKLQTANNWCDKTLSTRKTDKKVTVTIFVMQRLHQNDPTGHKLDKAKKKNKIRVKHICLPAEINTPEYRDNVAPKKLVKKYSKEGLLDPRRMPTEVLEEMEADMGQYEYAGQMGQNPTPPGGGMFQVDNFQIIQALPGPNEFVDVVRYWDKAGTDPKELKKGQKAAFTAGVKMAKLKDGRYIILDVRRGQWGATQRENNILATAKADRTQNLRLGNHETSHWIEQEPGSGGKESAQNTIRNLAGFVINAEHPKGDKVYRADPYSVQVNNGNIMLLQGEWNTEFIEEHRYFPFSTYKDQVDAAGAAFAKLTGKKIAKRAS